MKRLTRIMCEALRRHLAEGARPMVPEAGAIFWQAFADLSKRRIWRADGARMVPDPLSRLEVEAWARAHRLELRPDHVAVIFALDDAWLENARAGKGAAVPLTAAAFDAALG